jgi:thymidylate kinase
VILALEGPDRSGKSSVFEELRQLLPNAVFCASLPVSEELLPVMPQVEARQAKVWEQLYDPKKLYICDRFFAVTGQVYNKLFKRPCLMDYKRWYSELRVAYIVVPMDELERRFKESPDGLVNINMMWKVKEHYMEVLPSLHYDSFYGMRTPKVLAEEISEWISGQL